MLEPSSLDPGRTCSIRCCTVGIHWDNSLWTYMECVMMLGFVTREICCIGELVCYIGKFLVWEVSCTGWFVVTGGVIWYTGRFLLCRLAYMGRLLKWEGWSPGGCFIESLLFGGGEGFSYQGVWNTGGFHMSVGSWYREGLLHWEIRYIALVYMDKMKLYIGRFVILGGSLYRLSIWGGSLHRLICTGTLVI